MIGNPQPIGFFDSGVGGISVLIEAMNQLPNESFIYYGDSLNAPYGIKTVEEVQCLTQYAVDHLIKCGAKAVVIACNTATSASIQVLREKYTTPIIGMEPALKLAVDLNQQGAIAVLATPMTLKEKKFELLMERVGKKHQIHRIPAPELVLAIEANRVDEETLYPLLERYFPVSLRQDLSAVVLGCTHYIFAKALLHQFFDGQVALVDGNEGTVRQLKTVLEMNGALAVAGQKSGVEIIMTGGQKSEEVAKLFINKRWGGNNDRTE